MRDHVRILGILNIVLGSMGALAGLVVLLIFGGLAGVVGMSAEAHDAVAAVPILAVIGICIAGFVFVLSLPAIIGGWGLLKFKSWARILMIIVSGFNLLHVPLGTALGVYGLWVLLNQETQRLFDTGGAYIQPPAPYPSVATYPPQTPPSL